MPRSAGQSGRRIHPGAAIPGRTRWLAGCRPLQDCNLRLNAAARAAFGVGRHNAPRDDGRWGTHPRASYPRWTYRPNAARRLLPAQPQGHEPLMTGRGVHQRVPGTAALEDRNRRFSRPHPGTSRPMAAPAAVRALDPKLNLVASVLRQTRDQHGLPQDPLPPSTALTSPAAERRGNLVEALPIEVCALGVQTDWSDRVKCTGSPASSIDSNNSRLRSAEDPMLNGFVRTELVQFSARIA